MGHAKPEELKDLQDTLNQVRTWAGIKERSTNVFYYKSQPFLHFHTKAEQRWADIRDGESWGTPVFLPLKLSKADLRQFVKTVELRYQNLAKGKLR